MVPRFLALVVLAAVVYVPAYHGGLIWDDEDGYIAKNPFYYSVEGLREIWLVPGATPQYYPLVFTSFWIEYQLWGLDTLGYHLINVLWHALNAGMVWLVLRRFGVPGAWVAAAIFALHPVNVESVAWISERKNVMSGFFYLTSLLAFLRFSPFEQTRNVEEPGWTWYALAFVLFLLALLSKTVTCSLPAVLVLLYWWKRSLPTRREWLGLGPMFVVGAALAMVTSYVERNFVGARGESWAFTPVERCLIAGRALWFYVGKLAFPHPLMFNYPRWHIDASDPAQYGYPAGVILAFGLLLLSCWPRFWKRLGLEPCWRRGPLVACLIYAGTLLPALGFVNVYPMKFSFVADHFQYLASIAIIGLVVAGVVRLGSARGWARTRDGRILAAIATAALLATLAVLTWRHAGHFAGPDVLWRDNIAKNPGSVLANYNYGTRCLARDDIEGALECFERTYQADPNFSGLYINWGIALAKKGDYQAALDKMALALQYDERDPAIRYNMGLALTSMRKYAEALEAYKKAIDLDPNHAEAHFRLGQALLELDRRDAAVAELERAVELRPAEPAFRELLERAKQ